MNRRSPSGNAACHPALSQSPSALAFRSHASSPPSVLQGCFSIMAAFAHSLPISGIPEQGGISLVRDDVVGHHCGDHAVPFQTLYAQRISREVRPGGLAPFVGVTPGCRTPAPSVVLLPLLFYVAVAFARISKCRAAGMAAGSRRSERAHAALRFRGAGRLAAGFPAGVSMRIIADFPFSSTYPGRRRSSW